MKRFIFLILFSISFSKVFSQTIIAQQDFEISPGSPAWGYSVSGSGGSIQSGQNPSAGRPASGNRYYNGVSSFGTNNGTTILNFSAINTVFKKNIKVRFKLASFSITAGNGADLSDIVEVFFSTDSVNFYKEISISGISITSQCWWNFNADSLASRYYSGIGNFGAFIAPVNGENIKGLSTVEITDLPSVPNLYFRISLKNNSPGELWLIDDVNLTGEDNTSPTLLTTKKTISDINYLVNNGPSVPVNYNLTGINLTPSPGNVGLKAPANFEISLNENFGFLDTLTLAYTANSLPQTQIFSRLKASLGVGLYGGTGFNIVHNGGGAPNLNIKLDGKVSDGLACGTPVNIDSVRKTIPVQNAYTGLIPYTVKGKVTGVFGSTKFYIQDSTGGIAVFHTNIVSTNSLKIGDWVSLTGIPTRFNGEAEFVFNYLY